ncbi:MAG: hypothetical protein GF308_08350 [Candidatus Heimdallarchaeota archaeon]|nr:hypothetical protein [Candidatus Heimdallarchaeota archaeon]
MKYLKKTGTHLYLKLPPGGKYEYIQAPPGFVMDDKKKETLPRPYTVKTADGKTIKISTELMDRLKIITQMDFDRILRCSAIILTNFTGPQDKDIVKLHQARLQEWIAKDIKNRQQEFVGSLIMLDNIESGSKEILPVNDYFEAGTILGHIFKLW